MGSIVTQPSIADRAPSAWPRRWALVTLALALPLVFFGGTVTTLHAGLAIDGWWILEPGRGDHFLWFYPLDKWLRDTGTFVEHTHRQIGTLVGLAAIATVVSAFLCDRRWSVRLPALAALLAVVLQGTLGGLRVLEKSDELAFLHGVFGQIVFTILGASALALSFDWQAARPVERGRTRALRATGIVATVAVLAQSTIGAWLRHGGSAVALGLHGTLAVAAVVLVVRHAREIGRASGDDAFDAPARARLQRIRTSTYALLAAQVALGVFAFISVYLVVGRNPTEVHQSLFPTLHVVLGALLLMRCATSAMWCWRWTESTNGATEPRAVPLSRAGDVLGEGLGATR